MGHFGAISCFVTHSGVSRLLGVVCKRSNIFLFVSIYSPTDDCPAKSNIGALNRAHSNCQTQLSSTQSWVSLIFLCKTHKPQPNRIPLFLSSYTTKLTFPTKIFFDQNLFPSRFFLTQANFRPKVFLTKKFFDPKKFPNQIFFDPNNFRPNFF